MNLSTLMDLCFSVISQYYSSLPFAVLSGFSFMFLYKRVRENGLKETVKVWVEEFCSNREFRGTFVLAWYTVLMLFRTVLGRSFRTGVLSKLFTGWGVHATTTKEVTDALQNVVLFVPFIFLLFLFYEKRWFQGKSLKELIKTAFRISFLFSSGIELTQGLLGLGSVQIADVCYNTLGGVLGVVIFALFRRITRREETA